MKSYDVLEEMIHFGLNGGEDPVVYIQGFGVEPRIEEADESDEKVKVWCQCFYVNDSYGYYVEDGREFSREDAEEWIEEAESDVWFADTGEYQRPEYTMVAA